MDTATAPQTTGQSTTARPDLTRATTLQGGVAEEITRRLSQTHAGWNSTQQTQAKTIREIMIEAYGVAITTVPPSAQRTLNLQRLEDAVAGFNSAISSGGTH